HQDAEAEFLLEQAPEDFQFHRRNFRVEEQFHRIVAGFAVDIDATGKVRRFAVFQPEVVSEPCVLVSDGNEITGARVVDARLDLPSRTHDAGHAGRVFKQGDRFGFNRAVIQVDMRDLVVGDGENFAGTAIEHFQAEFVFDYDPTLLAKVPVEI